MKMFKIFISVLLLTMTLTAFSQDFVKDMIKVKSVYAKLKNYQCDYNISVYFNDKLNSSIYMDVKFSDSCCLYNIGSDITTICNASMMLTVDHDIKLIGFGKRKSIIEDLDEHLPKEADSVKYSVYSKKESNGFNTYTITYNEGGVRQCTITINPENGYIVYLDYINREMEEYDWRTHGIRKTVIKINQLKVIEPLPPAYFSMEKYITNTSEGYKPTPAYKAYHVINSN